MSVDIERRGVFGSLGHPILAKRGAPGKRVLLVGQMLQLAAYRAHFRRPIDAEQLSPLSGRVIAQGLDRSDPSQRHEGQQQKDRPEAIKTGGKAEVFVRAIQQPADQQRRKRQQNPAMRKIDSPLETRFGLGQPSDAGRHPFQRRRRPTPHRGGAVDLGSLALRARRYRLAAIFFFAAGRIRPADAAFRNVSGFRPSRSATSPKLAPATRRLSISATTPAVKTAAPRVARGA